MLFGPLMICEQYLLLPLWICCRKLLAYNCYNCSIFDGKDGVTLPLKGMASQADNLAPILVLMPPKHGQAKSKLTLLALTLPHIMFMLLLVSSSEVRAQFSPWRGVGWLTHPDLCGTFLVFFPESPAISQHWRSPSEGNSPNMWIGIASLRGLRLLNAEQVPWPPLGAWLTGFSLPCILLQRLLLLGDKHLVTRALLLPWASLGQANNSLAWGTRPSWVSFPPWQAGTWALH